MSHHQIRSEEQIEALGDEFQKLDAAYRLCQDYGATFVAFVEKPWYWRQLTELLEDGGHRPLLSKQRIAAMKADRELLRQETRARLQGGQIFEPLYHHRWLYNRDGSHKFAPRVRS